MPHAALLVVQHAFGRLANEVELCFNAARGVVGGAAQKQTKVLWREIAFQCRTRRCWWCSRAGRLRYHL